MIRIVLFLLGLLVMAGALLFALVPVPDPARFGWQWWWALGAALALGAHGWPDTLR